MTGIDVTDVLVVADYHDARAVLTGRGWTSDPMASPSRRAAANAIGLTELPLAQTMLLLDGAEHARVRNSIRDVFTPTYIAQLRDAVELIASDIFDAIDPDVPFDFMSQVAQPFPITVIAEWLGLDLTTATTLWREAATLVRALDLTFDQRTLPATAAAFTSLVAEFLPLAAQRRADPGDDLLSLLATDPALGLDEVVVNAILIAIAGHETTANLLGAAAVRLFTPSSGRRPIDDLDITDPRLVNELLRLDGPAQSILRVATEAQIVAGRPVEPGDVVMVDIANANRDPHVFEDPDTFSLDRDRPPPHLAFGFGVHRCVGAALAQLETAVALDLMLSREMEVVGPARIRESTLLRGLHEVPAVFGNGASR